MKKKPEYLMGKSGGHRPEHNISSYLAMSEQLDRRNTIWIDKSKLHIDPDNHKTFPQETIEDLCDWITFTGFLMNDLYVKRIDNTDEYMIVAGERRYHAICMMEDDVYKSIFPFGINCCLQKPNVDDDMSKLYQSIENLTQRDTTVYSKRAAILKAYNELDRVNNKGLINDALYDKLHGHLKKKEKMLKMYLTTMQMIPELESLMEKGQLTLTEAYSYSTLNEVTQKLIYEKKAAGENLSKDELDYFKVQEQYEEVEDKIEELEALTDTHRERLIEVTKQQEQLRETSKNKDLLARQETKVNMAKKKVDKSQSEIQKLYQKKVELNDKAQELQQAIEKQSKKPDIVSVKKSIHIISSSTAKMEPYKNIIQNDDELKSSINNLISRLHSLID